MLGRCAGTVIPGVTLIELLTTKLGKRANESIAKSRGRIKLEQFSSMFQDEVDRPREKKSGHDYSSYYFS